ncbi:MAG: hypothetical protein JJV97_06315 [SAR324 cluster bacterium]|nr:hypothetical protein [SAR324 cluster bacterium]
MYIVREFIIFFREHYFIWFTTSGVLFWYASAYLVNTKPLIPYQKFILEHDLSSRMILFDRKYGRAPLVLVLFTSELFFFLGVLGIVNAIIGL